MRVVPPGTRAARVVLATRPKVYPFRAHAMREIAREDKQPKHDRGGVGREIVREALACPACAAAGHLADLCLEGADRRDRRPDQTASPPPTALSG